MNRESNNVLFVFRFVKYVLWQYMPAHVSYTRDIFIQAKAISFEKTRVPVSMFVSCLIFNSVCSYRKYYSSKSKKLSTFGYRMKRLCSPALIMCQLHL